MIKRSNFRHFFHIKTFFSVYVHFSSKCILKRAGSSSLFECDYLFEICLSGYIIHISTFLNEITMIDDIYYLHLYCTIDTLHRSSAADRASHHQHLELKYNSTFGKNCIHRMTSFGEFGRLFTLSSF
jgi:hypothetical protein